MFGPDERIGDEHVGGAAISEQCRLRQSRALVVGDAGSSSIRTISPRLVRLHVRAKAVRRAGDGQGSGEVLPDPVREEDQRGAGNRIGVTKSFHLRKL